jgi:hypothetical protein
MPFNLFALCKVQGNLEARRIRLNQNLQTEVETLFNIQEQEFMRDITQETPFQGDWKPDSDELLTIDIPEDAQVINDTVSANLNSILDLDLNNFNSEPIKALFGKNNQGKILVQFFFKGQYLGRKLSLFLEDHTYNKLDSPAISFDNKLLCIIENNIVKFKSFQTLKYLFDLTDLYREATDTDINSFAAVNNILIPNIETFKTASNQNIRKRIHNLLQSGILSNYTANQINGIATQKGFNGLINVDNNKIVIPENNNKEVMKILSFLDDKLYRGAFSNNILRTNSTYIEGQ